MKQPNIRKPAVAGQFYPSTPGDLNRMISSFADKDVRWPEGRGLPSDWQSQKKDVFGCILPHAGYTYSGRVAVQTVSRVKIRDTLVLLGPNHTGNGEVFSLMPKGYWQTPLGNVEINSELASLFLSESKHLKADILAHLNEHSLEVELPILQYFRKDFKIIPIAIKTDDLDMLKETAEELAGVISGNNLKDSVMFIASSDLTHYEPQGSAEKKDALAIEAINSLDENKLEEVVKEFSISMCGFAPVAVLIKAAKLLGAKYGELIKYQTSGDSSGDTANVVGYAGITIY